LSPAQRDGLAVLGLACIVVAVALWQPLVGLGLTGVALIAIAFLSSFLRTAPAVEEENDGS
jgi:hypothetical protein